MPNIKSFRGLEYFQWVNMNIEECVRYVLISMNHIEHKQAIKTFKAYVQKASLGRHGSYKK